VHAARGFPQVRDSARAARHFVVGLLESRVADAVVADAAIVTTELAANAVLHGRSAFTVTVAQTANGIRVSVRDHSPLDRGSPLLPREGHGLDVVAKIAARWAVQPLADGKIVWAELPATSRP
jgi:anti-sigma regulatory factor (Ser/Thr protein kinase)